MLPLTKLQLMRNIAKRYNKALQLDVKPLKHYVRWNYVISFSYNVNNGFIIFTDVSDTMPIYIDSIQLDRAASILNTKAVANSVAALVGQQMMAIRTIEYLLSLEKG